jgi:hypothetical protein
VLDLPLSPVVVKEATPHLARLPQLAAAVVGLVQAVLEAPVAVVVR